MGIRMVSTFTSVIFIGFLLHNNFYKFFMNFYRNFTISKIFVKSFSIFFTFFRVFYMISTKLSDFLCKTFINIEYFLTYLRTGHFVIYCK